MDDRPGSPEIDVVGDGDKSKRFRYRSERFYSETTSLGRNSPGFRAANENGANLVAANTNFGARQRTETVNLRVRNMGIINVKKEPESDEDEGSSYSLSALLEECDFDKTPRRNNRPKSPTLSRTRTSKSVESSRSTGTAQGKSRQSLENVISSLKSARGVNIDKPKPTNGPSNISIAPISMPPQRISTAPGPPNISGPPSSAPVSGNVPQIVDVRSLASVVRPTPVTQQQMLGRSLNTGVQQRYSSSSSSTTTSHTPGIQGQVPAGPKTITPITPVTPGVNIRFVLPANVPFNTDQFQQVLQATLASLSTQTRVVEPDQLQKAIQAALISVTKSTVAFNPSQLQQAIQNSLASACGSSTASHLAQIPLAPQTVFPKTSQRQPQTIAPKPPSFLVQPLVTRFSTIHAHNNNVPSGNTATVLTENRLTATTSSTVSSLVTARTQLLTNTAESTLSVNGNSNNRPTSQAPVSSSHLTSARDALVKVLQESCAASLPSAMASSPCSITDSSKIPDSFDDNSFSVSPPSSPVLPLAEAPASNSRVNDRSSSVTSTSTTTSAGSTPPVAADTLSAACSESTPQTERGVPLAFTPSESASQTERVTSLVIPSESTTPQEERVDASVASVGSALQAETVVTSAMQSKSTSLQTERVAASVVSTGSAPHAENSTSATSVASIPQAIRGTPSVTSAGSAGQASLVSASVTTAGLATQVTQGASSVATAGYASQATMVSASVATAGLATQVTRGASSVTTAASAAQATMVSTSVTTAGLATQATQGASSVATAGSATQATMVSASVTTAGLATQMTRGASSVTTAGSATQATMVSASITTAGLATQVTRGASAVTTAGSATQATMISASITTAGLATQVSRGASSVTTAGSATQATMVSASVTTAGLATQVTRGASSVATAGLATQATMVSASVTTAGLGAQSTHGASSVASAGSGAPASRVPPSVASVVSIPRGERVASTVASTMLTSPATRASPSGVIDPQTKQVKSSLPTRSQTTLLSASAPSPTHRTNPAAVSNINLRISLPVHLPSASVMVTENKTVATPSIKLPKIGCGCCSNCKSIPESEDGYMCYYKGCGNVYHKESGLRKHHYFYPNHKPRIPLEKAAHSVDYFLPGDLNALHRTARLRELFKRLTNDEIKEHVLPRLSKTVSLFELLEIKSMRAQPYRGQPNMSAFKMFGEFERFRKEVENRLMALILLPQGRGRTKVEQKEDEKLSAVAKEADTAEAVKQGKKDAPPSINISDDHRTESSTCKNNAAPSSSSANSATSKKQFETICVESEAKKAPTASLTTPNKVRSCSVEELSGQGSVSSDVVEEVKETSDSSSKEKKPEESDRESTESGAASKQSKSSAQSLDEGGREVAGSTIPPGQTLPSEQRSKTTAGISSTSTVKDAVSVSMETDVQQNNLEVSDEGHEPLTTQSADLVMVDAEEKMEKSSKENPEVSQDRAIEMIDVDKDAGASTGEKRQPSVRSGEGGSHEQSGKQPTVVIEEDNGKGDKEGEKASVSAGKERSKGLATGKATDEMAADCNEESVSAESKAGNSKESGGDQTKSSETSIQEKSQVEQTETAGSSPKESSCSKSSTSADDNTDTQKETQKEASPLKQKLSKMLAEITVDDEDDIDENNLLEFGLPFAIKWGKIIKTTRYLEVKKIVRKESYSEQDMKQFIYSKPKEAAGVVISADCHAHPSFFRAYVMPALLDRHIDDFGLFGKKILSRLYLSQKKYVDVLRSGVGPEFAKILGINIFPTFKRIQDTWQNVKIMTPQEKIKRNLVLVLMAEDEHEVPDDEDETPPASNTANGMVTTSTVRGHVNTVQNPTIRAVGKPVQNTSIRPVGRTVQNSVVGAIGNTVQSTTGRGNDLLKRPTPTSTVQNNNSKRQRVDACNSDAQKDSSQADKAQTESSEKDACRTNNANEGQKADSIGNSTKNATKDKSKPDGKGQSKPNQAGSAEKQKEITSRGKSTTTENKTKSASCSSMPEKEHSAGSSRGPTVRSSSTSQKKTSSDHAYSKSPSTTNAADIIPKKATIYTSSGKVGTSPLPFSSTKGSPLYLVPVEKLSPKLLEQFINQAKGDGVRTRSASTPKKGAQPKQSSQVFVLVPSASPNGSPTIQTLTSEEQLKGEGDKKPLLLLPADKVPKSMVSQSTSARRKMVITMVAPSCASGSAALSVPQSVTTTSGSSTGSQQNESTPAGQSVQGTIMSARERNTDREATIPDSSAVASENAVSNDPKPGKESADSSITTLVSVANNTSALNSSMKGNVAEGVEAGVGAGPVDADDTDLGTSKEATAQSASDSDKTIGSSEESQLTNTSESVGAVDDSSELDLLPSLLPSDFTLDNLLTDIAGDGSANDPNNMLPLDVSQIISSFEERPVKSNSNTATSLSCDTVTASSEGVVRDSGSVTRSSREGSAVDNDRNTSSRRQSPRRVPTNAKSTLLTDVSSPNTSGGSRENSDAEDGSPPRKRRKTPIRTSLRTSPQVTFVPDKEVPGKSAHGSPSKSRGRKQ